VKRDVAQLASKPYDLLIIGGGIYGACVAWDAALRGLSVALVDRGDFGHATSANSLKIVHGGLRYLQDADLKLMRLMINERKAFMRIAPHLVHPLPCLMPTCKQFLKSKVVLGAALAINDLVGFDRNRMSDPQKHLPNGRIISKRECLEIMPGLADKNLTGGAIWYDAQMHNSERMTLSFVLSAAQLGAQVANYVEAVSFLRNDNCITGVRVRDTLTGGELDIQARIVVNTAGPWAEQVLKRLGNCDWSHKFYPSIAMNLVTRQIMPKYAIAVPSKYEFKEGKAIPLKKARILFIAPWRNYSLVGTIHLPFAGCIDDYKVTNREIQNFIDEVNTAYPGAALTREDVYLVHNGFLPAENNGRTDRVKLVRQGQIYDHQTGYNIEGLITLMGVKYTMARHVAEQVVDLVFQKLGRTAPPCRTRVTPLYGGQIERFDDFLTQETQKYTNGLSPETIQHLIYNYGSAYCQVLNYLDRAPEWGRTVTHTAQVIKAEVLHGIHEEMAQKLTDVVLRRTELGSAGWPGEACVRLCAAIMAAELGWDQIRMEREIAAVKAVYATTN
jgi:glycerol-3-phosphate dehydrogenase